MVRLLHILLIFCCFASPALANYREDGIKSGPGIEYPIHLHPALELGATIGTPAVLGNFVIGYWKGGAFPLLIRVSGMFWDRIKGLQWELGFAVDRQGHLRQNITLGGLTINDRTGDWSGLAGFYTLNWYGFFIQPGLTVGSGTLRSTNPQFIFQLGYTYLFRL